MTIDQIFFASADEWAIDPRDEKLTREDAIRRATRRYQQHAAYRRLRIGELDDDD